ncbi:MAG: sigma 54-interacting transcriptional regulator [Pseudomonadota bacterium]
MEKNSLILFLAEGGNNLELMALGLARKISGPDIGIIAATMKPPGINPLAREVMAEAGVDIAGLDQSQNTLLDIVPFFFDLAVTLGRFDPGCLPALPGMPPVLHWETPDPPANAPEAVIRGELAKARDLIRDKVETLFSSGMPEALSVTRRNLELILDNLLDGVMAHTRNRRIFFFNQAAERITGYKREDILGKDCHEVFPGRFCGGECEFCGTSLQACVKGVAQRDVAFLTPGKIRRMLRMSVMPLSDSQARTQGAVISFKDETELIRLKDRVGHRHSLGGLVGKDPLTLELFETIQEVAVVSAPVLIEGESGTGKELVANAIHELSARKGKPFVAVDCGALPEGILESELFGHVRGAFSGAVAHKKGRFELAHGGTLFLDEVAEMSLGIQAKILRAIQEQQFFRVGGEAPIQVDVRVLSATNRNLKKMVETRRFRRDLYYRLCVVPVFVPPLRERRLDIPMLIDHFSELVAAEIRRPVLDVANEVLDRLTRYPWPGNVRELHNAVEYAYVKAREGLIELRHLPPEIRDFVSKTHSRPGPEPRLSLSDILSATEKARGNRKKAAQILGVSRATLYRYIKQHGIH